MGLGLPCFWVVFEAARALVRTGPSSAVPYQTAEGGREGGSRRTGGGEPPCLARSVIATYLRCSLLARVSLPGKRVVLGHVGSERVGLGSSLEGVEPE